MRWWNLIGKRRTFIVDIFNVIFAFMIVILLGLRLESAIGESDKQALVLLVTIGFLYALYLFYFDLVSSIIKKFSKKPDVNIDLPVKLLAPFIVICLVFFL